MATPRKIGGYTDREQLRHALRLNAAARELVSTMAPLVAPDRRLARLTLSLANYLASQLQTLMEMEYLRLAAATTQDPPRSGSADRAASEANPAALDSAALETANPTQAA